MRSPHRLVSLALALTAVFLASGCAREGSSGDKAGGAGHPVVLRMANASGDLGPHPTVAYFVQRVEELSEGAVRIEVANQWGDFAPDAEQQVVRGVSAGEVDLGWAGTRIFDTMGVTSFQALTAPMLVDSYALQHAVIESGMTGQMMQALDDLGVVGLGILPDGLRKPIGVVGPISEPANWRDITFGTLTSNGQAEAIRALQATPLALTGTYRDEAAEKGTIEGFELSLALYNPTLRHLAPFVTTNLNLWPLMDVMLANPQRLAALTAEQRGWLQDAADDAAGRSDTFVALDANVVEDACATGVRFAIASDADLTALREAFVPVYATLQRDRPTRLFIEQIQELKRSIRAEPPPVVPPACTGEVPEQRSDAPVPAPADLSGTYRWEITLDEALEADMVDPEDTYPQVITAEMEDGQFSMGPDDGGLTGTYMVEGDRITFDIPDFGYALTFTFSADADNRLHLTPVQPMDPGDAFVFASQTWTKID